MKIWLSPKTGIFAEAQAKVVSQQIINDIENDSSELSSRVDGKELLFYGNW